MKSKKLKILFFINTITSYQLDFFNELNRFCYLKVIFYKKNYSNYNFHYRKKKYFNFLEKEKNKVLKIKNIINTFKPDFTIIGGYRLPHLKTITKSINKIDKKYLFWLERLNKENLLKYKIVKHMIKRKAKFSNGILCVGVNAKKEYQDTHKNLINLPYSINTKKFNFKKKFFLNKKTNFLFVGQLIKRKGIDLILSSFNSLQNYEKSNLNLTIIGEGDYKQKVLEFSKQNSFVTYKSFLTEKKLIPYFLNNDVFLFPSNFDGWGVAPLEAMASSMNLILSKNVGMLEIFRGKNKPQILAKENNLTQLIKSIIKNQSQIIKIGTRNKIIVKNSLCNVNKSTQHLLNSLKYL